MGPFPEMGLAGAAVATTIGRSVGVIYQLNHLFGYSSRINSSFGVQKNQIKALKRMI